jgi:NDP-sugar pyrophosphorylase family protein
VKPQTNLHDFQSTTVAVLVGGLGTRLRSVVADRPKPLAEIHGRPFLDYLLDQLAASGLRDVVLCSGYRADQIEATLGNQYKSLFLRHSQETEPLGTAGALRFALSFLTSEMVLVLNGDSLCECDLYAFWQWHLAHQGKMSLVLTQVSDIARYGQVEVDEDCLVTCFAEKDLSKSRPGWINAGIYMLPREEIAKFPEHKTVSLERDVFPAWIGHGLFGYQVGGRFIDIGTPESYQSASQFFSIGDAL